MKLEDWLTKPWEALLLKRVAKSKQWPATGMLLVVKVRALGVAEKEQLLSWDVWKKRRVRLKLGGSG